MIAKMNTGYLYICICVVFNGILFKTITPTEASPIHDIWNNMFIDKQYNMNVRPVLDETSVTTINISMSLISVIDFSEVRQTITLATKLTLAWKDEYLMWDATNFSNVENLHVYQKDIWKPSIFLENSVTKQAELGTPYLHVLVGHDGVVEWRTLEVFETTCMTDVTQFPFDEQVCSLIFEPFGYTDSEIKVLAASEQIEIHSYGGSAGWTIMGTELERAEGDEGVHVLASLTLKRNPIYMILNIMLPIACLSFLNNCVFLLPVESGEKASFSVTVFLALAVFLTIVSQQLPENSDHASLLNIYVIISTLTSVIVAILTIVQIRVYHKNSKLKVPACLAKFVLCCSSKRCTPTPIDICNNKNIALVGNIFNGTNDLATDVDEHEQVQTDFTHEVTWPELVKALDNLYFILFMVMYTTITFAFLMTVIYGRYNKYAAAHDSD